VSSDDEDDEIYDAIDEILSRGMPNVLRLRAWLEFVINRLANDAVITCFKTDEYDLDGRSAIDARKLSGKWDEAYEILCQHVTAAAAEIRVLSLEEDVDNVD
jgi:hypothetical protein